MGWIGVIIFSVIGGIGGAFIGNLIAYLITKV